MLKWLHRNSELIVKERISLHHMLQPLMINLPSVRRFEPPSAFCSAIVRSRRGLNGRDGRGLLDHVTLVATTTAVHEILRGHDGE